MRNRKLEEDSPWHFFVRVVAQDQASESCMPVKTTH